MENYNGHGEIISTDGLKKVLRIAHLMQMPNLHKGQAFRMVSDKPVLPGEKFQHTTECAIIIDTAEEAGESEFSGLKNYMCMAKGYA